MNSCPSPHLSARIHSKRPKKTTRKQTSSRTHLLPSPSSCGTNTDYACTYIPFSLSLYSMPCHTQTGKQHTHTRRPLHLQALLHPPHAHINHVLNIQPPTPPLPNHTVQPKSKHNRNTPHPHHPLCILLPHISLRGLPPRRLLAPPLFPPLHCRPLLLFVLLRHWFHCCPATHHSQGVDS